MSMARKLAGVTKDNKVYETLESRFGMFLASNTQGERFSIQCVGLAKTSHMELAGDPTSHDPTVDVLMNELNSSEGAQAAAEAAEDKAMLRKSLEADGRDGIRELFDRDESLFSANGGIAIGGQIVDRHFVAGKGSNPYFVEDIPLTRVPSPENQEGSFSDRLSKGAALVKSAYRKYKPIVMAQVSSSGCSSNSDHNYNSVINSVGAPSAGYNQNQSSTQSSSVTSDYSGDDPRSSIPRAAPPITQRADSGEDVLFQTETRYEDLGRGIFPTVHISSRPGGHFDGTLRVSQKDVQVHRRKSKFVAENKDSSETGSHPRFLKLHAYHPGMTEHCHGIVNLVDPEGISIISDIDDTIKETNVTAGARIILRNTFLKDMQDVPGMSQVYNQWWEQGAAIHYVSNSPWQLIPSLLEFFHSHKFPPGSAHLRLHDSVLKTYFMDPGENKRRSICEILRDFPERKFILVGDSGEIDMEIYTEMARMFPDQIFKIFIRDITTTRLKEAQVRQAAGPPTSSRLVSMLPRTTGLFSRQANDTSADFTDDLATDLQGGTTVGSFLNPKLEASTQSVRPLPGAEKRGNMENRKEGGALRGGTHREDFASEAATSRTTTAAASSGTGWPSIVSLDDEPMPGAAAVESPVSKTPLEVWLERIEECQKKLPEGMLTFFEDARELQSSPIVNEMLRHHAGSHNWDEDDDDGSASTVSSDRDGLSHGKRLGGD
ncbi:hypothetical protein BGX28_000229 [Mortierella sp. GBA30]|nr:hypothetical protein BGX28_000229 [Mortierella sp. GBA30]